jgi:uncharacterized protein (DUF58 family)
VKREYRELRPSGVAAGAGVLVAVTWTIWRTSGSRASLFVCVATVAVAVVDVGWALMATRRVRLTTTANPPEAIVGDTVAVEVAFGGPRQFLTVTVSSFRPAAPVGVDVPTSGLLAGVATTRAVVPAIEVEVVNRGLAGFVACARRRTVPLARPLFVGPRPLPAAGAFPELFGAWGEGRPRPAPAGDVVRGVRPYLPGDPMRRVHWPSTARTGELVVKEVEDTAAPRLVVVLDLGAGGAAGERAAGRAAWYAGEGLRRGYAVVLVTSESAGTGTVRAAATSSSDVTRRLAAATRGTPTLAEASTGGPTVPDGPVLLVTDRGDSWR